MKNNDKIQHFVVSIAIVFILNYLLHSINMACALTLLIGIAKEVYDKVSGKGTADIYDIFSDVLGVLLAYFIIKGF